MFQNYCRQCKKDVDPVLDTKLNIIVCPDCLEEFKNMSEFIKIQLKTFSQTLKPKKSKKAFSVRCHLCQFESPPIMKSHDLFVCASCGQELKLTEPFKQLVRENIKQTS
jgi:DNA-directed RNA polymerase subunit RPC12/RpoP